MMAAPVIPPKICMKVRIAARTALRAPTRNMPRLWSEERRAASQRVDRSAPTRAPERSERA